MNDVPKAAPPLPDRLSVDPDQRTVNRKGKPLLIKLKGKVEPFYRQGGWERRFAACFRKVYNFSFKS
jgi:hypothetical protein